MKKIVVYTAIFNNYDWLKEPVVVPAGIDFVCYTDSDRVCSKVWRIVKVCVEGISPSLLNRKIKLLYPYTELSQYDYSLYVDGSIMIKGDVAQFLQPYIPMKVAMMNFKHPYRDCMFDDISLCIQRKSGNMGKLLEQSIKYKDAGMPLHFGLSDNKIILRDHRQTIGKRIMDEWYQEVEGYSGRDQVCLPYVLYKNHISYFFFKEDIENNDFFETWPHNTVEWYIRYWRHLKWFCERNHILGGSIAYFDERIKPWLLKKI